MSIHLDWEEVRKSFTLEVWRSHLSLKEKYLTFEVQICTAGYIPVNHWTWKGHRGPDTGPFAGPFSHTPLVLLPLWLLSCLNAPVEFLWEHFLWNNFHTTPILSLFLGNLIEDRLVLFQVLTNYYFQRIRLLSEAKSWSYACTSRRKKRIIYWKSKKTAASAGCTNHSSKTDNMDFPNYKHLQASIAWCFWENRLILTWYSSLLFSF